MGRTAQFTYMQVFFNSKDCNTAQSGLVESWIWKNHGYRGLTIGYGRIFEQRSASLTLIWFSRPQRGIHSYSIVKLLNPEDRRDRRKGSSSKEQLIILAQDKLQNNSQ